jgi:hypothetical protein
MGRRKAPLANEDYALCRTYGHQWEDGVLPPDYRPQVLRNCLCLRCARCSLHRIDSINSLGQVGSRRYLYPDDYRLTAEERPTREALRLWRLQAQRKGQRSEKAA